MFPLRQMVFLPRRTIAVGALALALSGALATAHAAVFTVNGPADAADAVPGDGICRSAGGRCTLRAAIQETNALLGYDRIVLPRGTYRLPRRGPFEELGATGDLNFRDDVDIYGAGAARTIIDGGFCSDPESAACNSDSVRPDQDRVMSIVPNGNGPKVGLRDLTVQNGGGRFISGGGIYVRGGTSLALLHVRVRANRGSQFGGGIGNFGGLQIVESTIEGNMTPLGVGNGQTESGGGIYNGGSLEVWSSTISGNKATRGAGIRNDGGFVDIKASTISGNRANTRGGGIMNSGVMNIIESTIVDNLAYAAYPRRVDQPPWGGGIYNDGDKNGGGLIRLSSTILARNTNSLTPGSFYFAPDCFSAGAARIESYRYNLIGAATAECRLVDFAGGAGLPFDQVGTDRTPIDPVLASLDANGGPTFTSAPFGGSPAVDRGPPRVGDCTPVDQRGYVRPVDGDGKAGARCDVGAVEYASHPR
jgi:CSLREA domain-containing protein